MGFSFAHTGGSAVFYTPGAVATEIRSGYLFKSPPPKRMKSEVTDSAQYSVWTIHFQLFMKCDAFFYFDHVSLAEIVEEAVFRAVQNQ